MARNQKQRELIFNPQIILFSAIIWNVYPEEVNFFLKLKRE
jgi:hypothetical protein